MGTVPEDQDQFINNFRISKGIELDKDAIRPKPENRGLANTVTKFHVR